LDVVRSLIEETLPSQEKLQKEWSVFRKDMDSELFVVNGIINNQFNANVMVDTGCTVYSLCDPSFIRKSKNTIQRISVDPFSLEAFDGKPQQQVTEVCVYDIDLSGYRERVWAYVVPLDGYDFILGNPWVIKRDVHINGKRQQLLVNGIQVDSQKDFLQHIPKLLVNRIGAVAFKMWARKSTGYTNLSTNRPRVFAASLKDINKALDKLNQKDKVLNLKELVPIQYHKYLPVFDQGKANELPPHRLGLDHEINVNGEPPFGPLYNMSRDELLVLRKTLTDLLDKGFIRVSASPAGAPVLFVHKPGGGLRFCVDYRALNQLTVKDRYPLPLIRETLNNIAKAKWFTKLDVIAAFHKIRIREGDEWKSAFRTRFGSYEWLVTPFGMANAPSTFQRYINWTLRDFLDDFASAYIDDILIYSSGSLQDHRDKVQLVLAKLQEAGLYIDIQKCDFEVQKTKYLGFIIEAGKGISMDPEKVKAIQDWEAPKSVKGVRGFLGFANFYRRFIQRYSDLARPLVELTKVSAKTSVFKWTGQAQEAFEKLKKVFISAPSLLQFDFDKDTRIETDSSGWCIGGTLLQPDSQGLWTPCAFFSKKLSSTECNYPIYDKEMLAIIRALEEWDSELRGVKKFEICSDHKNLEYFMTTRKLSERQVRWSQALSRYDFTIRHIKGITNEQADALSRRDQDLPTDQDDRVQAREFQLIKPEWVDKQGVLRVSVTQTRSRRQQTQENQLQNVRGNEDSSVEIYTNLYTNQDELLTDDIFATWDKDITEDTDYQDVKKALVDNERRFPAHLSRLRLSIIECKLDRFGNVLFRNRRWIPDTRRDIRTRLIQRIHDSQIHVHPGREALYAIVARDFYWPQIGSDIRRFIANCDSCNANKAWKQRKQGFLKPLPIPERIWSDISMDFVVDLPESKDHTGRVCTSMVVVTDRLGKGIVTGALPDIKIGTVLSWFFACYYPHHFLPRSIVSDRGVQFVSALWKRICNNLSIKRLLSTAYHPETDGATERQNEVVKTSLRELVNWQQDDWAAQLPIATSAICGRDSRSIGVSSFFLSHGWNQSVFPDIDTGSTDYTNPYTNHGPTDSPRAVADRFTEQMKKTREFIQTSMAEAQQRQEEQWNRYRQQSTAFKVGDKVWLSMENIKTKRPKKGLDHRYQKFTVLEVLGSHSYRLNTPPGIYDVFHSKLLQLARSDPLSSQQLSEPQNSGIDIGDNVEYEVEKILDEKRGRGQSKWYLVKWVGYTEPTWEPFSFVQDLQALDLWELTKGGEGDDVRG
jgi:transposase InsO family protein